MHPLSDRDAGTEREVKGDDETDGEPLVEGVARSDSEALGDCVPLPLTLGDGVAEEERRTERDIDPEREGAPLKEVLGVSERDATPERDWAGEADTLPLSVAAAEADGHSVGDGDARPDVETRADAVALAHSVLDVDAPMLGDEQADCVLERVPPTEAEPPPSAAAPPDAEGAFDCDCTIVALGNGEVDTAAPEGLGFAETLLKSTVTDAAAESDGAELVGVREGGADAEAPALTEGTDALGAPELLPDEVDPGERDAGTEPEGAPLGDDSAEAVGRLLAVTEREDVTLAAPLPLGALPLEIALAEGLAPREGLGIGDGLAASVAVATAASDAENSALELGEPHALGERETLTLGDTLRESRGVGVVERDAEGD